MKSCVQSLSTREEIRVVHPRGFLKTWFRFFFFLIGQKKAIINDNLNIFFLFFSLNLCVYIRDFKF